MRKTPLVGLGKLPPVDDLATSHTIGFGFAKDGPPPLKVANALQTSGTTSSSGNRSTNGSQLEEKIEFKLQRIEGALKQARPLLEVVNENLAAVLALVKPLCKDADDKDSACLEQSYAQLEEHLSCGGALFEKAMEANRKRW